MVPHIVLTVVIAFQANAESTSANIVTIQNPRPTRVRGENTIEHQSAGIQSAGNPGSSWANVFQYSDWQGVTSYEYQATDTLFAGSRFRNNEFLSWSDDIKNGILMIRFYSQLANPNSPARIRSEVFSSGSFPIGGCIAGYYWEDYFPNKQYKFEKQDRLAFVENTTKYGRCQMWIDLEHGNLPTRVIVEQREGNMTTGNRRVEDVIYNHSDHQVSVQSVSCEMNVSKFGKSDTGEWFIEACDLIQHAYSTIGLEGTLKVVYSVNEIDFAPLGNAQHAMTRQFPDRHHVIVEGAPQLPYVWSEQEQWAVPDVRYAAAPVPLRSSQKFYYVAAAVALLMLACALVYWKQRR